MQLSQVKELYDARQKINNIYRRTNKNEIIADYYKQLAEETGDERYTENGARVYWCSRGLTIDYYIEHKIKDIKKIELCHDKFCENCQNARSVKAERKFEPVIQWFAARYSVYSMVFTVPNPEPEELQPTLDKMYLNIGYMFRLFRGNAKIKGYDFKKYGFLGAIRSLEITKSTDGTFHPHFHVLAMFRHADRIDTERKFINSYSFDNQDIAPSHRAGSARPQRLFTAFEILLQKVWRLRCEGLRVNKKNIEALKEGYSVIAKKANEKDYKEVFKYSMKGIFKHGADTSQGYSDFVALALALKGRRITQGYGAFRSIDTELYLEQEDKAESADLLYDDILREVKKDELPVTCLEWLYEVVYQAENNANVTYIARRSVSESMANDYDGNE